MIQAAPTILTAVTNSEKANDTLSSFLAADLAYTASFNGLDITAKASIASRIVNGAPGVPSAFDTEGAIDDVTGHFCSIGAQAMYDTFVGSSIPLEERERFRDMALAVASHSSTLAGAVNTMNFVSFATTANVSGSDQILSDSDNNNNVTS